MGPADGKSSHGKSRQPKSLIFLKRHINVGVDMGGTWLRVAAVDGRSGRPLWRLKAPCTTPHDLPILLKKILRRRKVHPNRLTAGSTGIWDTKDRRRLHKNLKSLGGSVHVLSDLEIAWLGALEGRPGVLILAGTGSCAYGRDGCGHWRREGGLGPLLGDEGSAFWIGREWIKNQPDRALRLAHNPTPVRAVAALAPTVISRSRKNDNRARSILRSAQDALIQQMENVARGLHFRKPISFSWHGGLFKNAVFQRTFLKRLSKSSRAWTPVAPKQAPEMAAALLPPHFWESRALDR